MSRSFTDHPTKLSRRSMLQGLIFLYGTGALAACTRDNTVKDIASDGFGKVFGKRERVFLNRIADIIIPDTDTPGAIKAGVPDYMKHVYDHWIDADGKKEWLQGLVQIYQAINLTADKDFLEMTPELQTRQIVQLDNAVYQEDVTVPRNETLPKNSGQEAGHIQYRELKNEIATAYYLSEDGATKELRYELVPGEWKACIPFSEIGRTWSI